MIVPRWDRGAVHIICVWFGGSPPGGSASHVPNILHVMAPPPLRGVSVSQILVRPTQRSVLGRDSISAHGSDQPPASQPLVRGSRDVPRAEVVRKGRPQAGASDAIMLPLFRRCKCTPLGWRTEERGEDCELFTTLSAAALKRPAADVTKGNTRSMLCCPSCTTLE